MAQTFYIPYLILLLVLPLLAQRRWGLVGSLTVTVVELGTVVPIFYLMGVYHLSPSRIRAQCPNRDSWSTSDVVRRRAMRC
jgi:hypothetical protein